MYNPFIPVSTDVESHEYFVRLAVFLFNNSHNYNNNEIFFYKSNKKRFSSIAESESVVKNVIEYSAKQ